MRMFAPLVLVAHNPMSRRDWPAPARTLAAFRLNIGIVPYHFGTRNRGDLSFSRWCCFADFRDLPALRFPTAGVMGEAQATAACPPRTGSSLPAATPRRQRGLSSRACGAKGNPDPRPNAPQPRRSRRLARTESTAGGVIPNAPQPRRSRRLARTESTVGGVIPNAPQPRRNGVALNCGCGGLGTSRPTAMEPDDDNMDVRFLERLVVPSEGAPCVIDLDALREKRLPQNRHPVALANGIRRNERRAASIAGRAHAIRRLLVPAGHVIEVAGVLPSPEQLLDVPRLFVRLVPRPHERRIADDVIEMRRSVSGAFERQRVSTPLMTSIFHSIRKDSSH